MCQETEQFFSETEHCLCTRKLVLFF